MNAPSDHNIKELEGKIQEAFVEYAECDESSSVLNTKRADIREKVEGWGLDRKAFHDQYMRAKRKLREKEGYDESTKICHDALNKMDQGELFEFVGRQKKEREEARAAKKDEAKKATAASKAKVKKTSAPKPKQVSGKDAAAGEGKETSVGEQQAAAFQKAHGNGKEAETKLKSVN